MKIAVGSKNPVKIKAVENVFRRIFGKIEIVSCEVNSSVSHTPSSWEEIA